MLELRDDLATWMLEHDIQQWRPGELPLEWIQTCVSEGWVYVVPRGERVIASVSIVWDDPFMWGEMPEPTGYIHMLMVDRNFAGQGIGRSLLAWTEQFIGDSGRHLARLDCARSNRHMPGSRHLTVTMLPRPAGPSYPMRRSVLASDDEP